jgi:hypothetical protein
MARTKTSKKECEEKPPKKVASKKKPAKKSPKKSAPKAKKAAPLDPKHIVALNVKLGKSEEMKKITAVYKTPTFKEGIATGKFRFGVSGKGSDGTNMNRFVSEEGAKDVSKEWGLKIIKKDPKPKKAKRVKKTCKEIGVIAEEKCEMKRAESEEKKKKKPAAKKKKPAKKSSAKRSAKGKEKVKRSDSEE